MSDSDRETPVDSPISLIPPRNRRSLPDSPTVGQVMSLLADECRAYDDLARATNRVLLKIGSARHPAPRWVKVCTILNSVAVLGLMAFQLCQLFGACR